MNNLSRILLALSAIVAASARVLLHVEQRSPGLLQSRDASCEGIEGYETVKQLYRDFESQTAF